MESTLQSEIANMGKTWTTNLDARQQGSHVLQYQMSERMAELDGY